MAKGQVTSDDLSTGIKGFGGLSSLGGPARPARDNPFRDTRADAAPVPAVEPPGLPPVEPEPPRLEVIARRDEAQEEVRGEPPPVERRAPAPPKRPSAAVRPAAKPVLIEPDPPATERKTDLYTERVTVPLNAELRDRSEALARDIQRHRTQKGERITSNTVYRVAIRALLDILPPGSDLGINTENDLYDAVVKRVSRK